MQDWCCRSSLICPQKRCKVRITRTVDSTTEMCASTGGACRELHCDTLIISFLCMLQHGAKQTGIECVQHLDTSSANMAKTTRIVCVLRALLDQYACLISGWDIIEHQEILRLKGWDPIPTCLKVIQHRHPAQQPPEVLSCPHMCGD